jgi:hypothetical protein
MFSSLTAMDIGLICGRIPVWSKSLPQELWNRWTKFEVRYSRMIL